MWKRGREIEIERGNWLILVSLCSHESGAHTEYGALVRVRMREGHTHTHTHIQRERERERERESWFI